MKRQFPRIERHALLGLAAALTTLGAAACSPNTSVQPGAPVLSEMVVVESGTPYKITPGSPICSAEAGVMEGATCDPAQDQPCEQLSSGADAAAADGNNWCRCRDVSACPEFAPPPATSTWNCGGFPVDTAMFAIFDRVIDTTPLDPGDAALVTGIANVTSRPAAPAPVTVDTIYTPNGSPQFNDAGLIKELLLSLYERCVYGTFNGDGPNLSLVADPQLPAGATVTMALDPTKVLAKDGRTQFSGTGRLLDGALTFQTVAFIASIAVPQPATPDGGAGGDAGAPATTVPPDATPVTITFTGPVDPSTIGDHITVTSNGTPLTFTMATADGGMTAGDLTAVVTSPTVTITPTATWPASATISVTVDKTASDLLGDTLPGAVSASFMTAAM